jgi:hypothetical protein
MLDKDHIPNYAALRNTAILTQALGVSASIILVVMAGNAYFFSSDTGQAINYLITAFVLAPVSLIMGQLIEAYRDLIINSWHQRMMMEKMHHEMTRPPSEESRLFRP